MKNSKTEAEMGEYNILKWDLKRVGMNSREWVAFAEERGAWKEGIMREAEDATQVT